MSAIDPERTLADLVLEQPGRARTFGSFNSTIAAGGRAASPRRQHRALCGSCGGPAQPMHDAP